MSASADPIQVAKLLKQKYPNPKTELVYSGEMQLAVAVMLSAQTTDKKVNQITKGLFQKYPTWQDFANADLTVLQIDIRGVKFQPPKRFCRYIAGNYQKQLPNSQ